MPRLDLSGVLDLRGASNKVVDGAGVNRVALHVLCGVAHDGMARRTGGHDIKSFGLGKGKVAGHQSILKFRVACLMTFPPSLLARGSSTS